MKMKPNTNKKFDSVKFYKAIKQKMAEKMKGMTLVEQKEFMRKIREVKIKLT